LSTAGVGWPQIGMTAAGLAGVDYDRRGAEVGRAMLEACGARDPLVEGDMVIAHAGALAGGPGVLALAGTGSAVLAIDACDGREKIGGWGPIYGDQGSAFRIAQMGLAAAARAFDGTGERTMLIDALNTALGLTDFRESSSRVYGSGMSYREIAALSPIVAETATRGDDVARRILERAGQDLAFDVATAAARLEMRVGISVSYAGAVLTGCDSVRAAFEAAVRARMPIAHVAPPRLPPIGGAYLLARRRSGCPVPAEAMPALERMEW
jgi:N-acetylglucosamine kinase-like BadF-type ATPase